MKPKVASIQYEFSDKLSKEDRIRKAEKFIDSCADADLILLPELWNFGWHTLFDKDIASIERLRNCSETLEGETISRIAENECIVRGEIDLEELRKFRKVMPHIQNRVLSV